MKYYDCLTCGVSTPNKWRRSTAAYCSMYCRTRIFVKTYTIPKPDVKQFSGKTKLINGMFIVNAEYFDWLNQFKWHLSDTGYAVRRNIIDGKKVTKRMHRLVVGAGEDDSIVDHIDRNKWNNTRENLRITTQSVNAINTDRVELAKRYCWDKSRQKWMVRIDNKYVGRYDTEQEAIDKVKEMLCRVVL